MTALDESYPFDAGAGAGVDEAKWRKMARLWRATGVVSGLAVSPNAAMVLNVSTGSAWVDGFWGAATATKTVTISTAHASNPRIDLVVLRLDITNNAVTIEVLTGTPAVSPTEPALTQLTAGNYEIALARVAVAAAATSISAGNITDRRTFSGPGGGGSAPANPVLNASAWVWQDGTSIACGTGAYTSDGWYGRRATAATGQTVSQQAAGDTQGSPKCWRQLRDSGNASTAQMLHEQTLSTNDSLPFAGQTVTLSGRMRATANYSGGAASLALISGTGTDEKLRNGLTGQATVGTASGTPSTSWQTISVTATVPSNVTQLAIQEAWTPTGTAGAVDGVEWKDIRLDLGSVVQTHVPNTYDDDLFTAQYTWWRMALPVSGDICGRGTHNGTTESRIVVRLPRTMRTGPTASFVAGAVSDVRILSGDGTKTPSALNTAVVYAGNVVELPFAVTGVTNRGNCELAALSGTPAIGFDGGRL